MTRDELIEKLDTLDNDIDGDDRWYLEKVADFILTNFVSKSKKMYEGEIKLDFMGDAEILNLDEVYLGENKIIDIIIGNEHRSAIFILED